MLTLHHIVWVGNPISFTQGDAYVCRVYERFAGETERGYVFQKCM